MESNQVTILGARGSVPVSGAQYSLYGGATPCVLVETDAAALVFDAGTGLNNLPQRVMKKYKKLHIFLSHLHLDHLLGIPMSPVLFDESFEVVFYAEDAGAAKNALRQMMERPLWPVGPEVFSAKVDFRSIGEGSCRIPDSPVTVHVMQTAHPGGALAFRTEWEGKSLVYATDCELDASGSRQMEKFAADTQLFILDAQYTKEEYEKCRGYGHSYIQNSAAVIEGSHATRGLLFHHAPTHTDEQLQGMEQKLQQKWSNIGFAKEGEQIPL